MDLSGLGLREARGEDASIAGEEPIHTRACLHYLTKVLGVEMSQG